VDVPILLFFSQAQLLALASDPDTFLQDPDPLDDLANDWNRYYSIHQEDEPVILD
jgi:hypothetical protein